MVCISIGAKLSSILFPFDIFQKCTKRIYKKNVPIGLININIFALFKAFYQHLENPASPLCQPMLASPPFWSQT